MRSKTPRDRAWFDLSHSDQAAGGRHLEKQLFSCCRGKPTPSVALAVKLLDLEGVDVEAVQAP